MMNWEALPKPAEVAENRLIDAILEGVFPPGSSLPAERELAAQIGVTRPTLRETLQRLARDGWLEIRHGKPTRVRDLWQEGSLGVLGAIAHRPEHLPPDFIFHLLTIRRLLAPAYTRLAVERDPQAIQDRLAALLHLEDTPEAYTDSDLDLHCALTIASGNPIFTLILNGFRDLYQSVGRQYFTPAPARQRSRRFYQDLLSAVVDRDPLRAEAVALEVMADSLDLWRAAEQTLPQNTPPAATTAAQQAAEQTKKQTGAQSPGGA